MDMEKYASEICKTGFVLENQIASILNREGWTVISNKYYEDDLEGSVREIDLLAYKASKNQNFDVYTTLLISCKKNEANAWALLSRDINLKDPNSDWWPLHAWSNEKSLAFELSQQDQSRKYHEDIKKYDVKEALSIPEVEVFAFQEMKKKGGAPQNDKNIFNAITSLMKAQAYELSSLPQRRKAPAVYQFNLLSVIDSDLIRLKFSDDEIKTEPINSEHYIARYIIKKKESFSRVRFLKASYFVDALSDYNRLHIANCKWFDQMYNRFFELAIKDWKRSQVIIDDFQADLKWPLLYRIKRKCNKVYEPKDLNIEWRADKGCLAVTLPIGSDITGFLNGDEESRKAAQKALKKIFRYSGEFFFDEEEIPF